MAQEPSGQTEMNAGDWLLSGNFPPDTRNYKCDFCRNDKQKCVWQNPDQICERCRGKNRCCSAKRRMLPSTTAPSWNGLDPMAEYVATHRATYRLLYHCKSQIRFMKRRIYPWPCEGLNDSVDEQTTPFQSQSLRLSTDLQPLASRLRFQGDALRRTLERVQDSEQDPWATAFQLGVHQLPFHPVHFVTPASAARANDISISITGIYKNLQSATVFDREQAQSVPLEKRLQRYCYTAENVRQLLGCAIFNTNGTPILNTLFWTGYAFPASHIAYWNDDKEAAIELCLISPHAMDILGRMFVHIVVEAGDINTLNDVRLANIVQGVVKMGWKDARHLSILAIGACVGNDCRPDSIQSFEKLLDLRPWPVELPGPFDLQLCLLDLGLASGSKEIVRSIVGSGIVSPPYTAAMQKIIELGRANLAECFPDWVFARYWTHQQELTRLAILARAKAEELRECGDYATAMYTLARRLEGLYFPTGPRTQALQDVSEIPG